MREAERIYRRGLAAVGPDALLMFNLGVLLEDLDRPADALEAYQVTLARTRRSPIVTTTWRGSTSRWVEPQHAIRHLGQYRRLVIGDSH